MINTHIFSETELDEDQDVKNLRKLKHVNIIQFFEDFFSKTEFVLKIL